MNHIECAEQILSLIGFGAKQVNTMCCLTLLALANLKASQPFSESTNHWIRIHDILIFCKKAYNASYAENSRETFRKQALHYFRLAGIVEDNGKATNSPAYRYRLTLEMLDLIRHYQTDGWKSALHNFLQNHERIKLFYESKRQKRDCRIMINDMVLSFSPGKHNELQCAVLEDFVKHFVPNCVYLYCGDTRDKDLFCDTERLNTLGLTITTHEIMPDIILYSPTRNWLYFIECVTSVGPFSTKRVAEVIELCKSSTAGKIFVTAFLDRATYAKFSSSIAWETEIWIASNPEHMIHMNGDKFLGPH